MSDKFDARAKSWIKRHEEGRLRLSEELQDVQTLAAWLRTHKPPSSWRTLNINDPDSDVINSCCRFVEQNLINVVLCGSTDPDFYTSEAYTSRDGQSIYYSRGTAGEELNERFESRSDAVRCYFDARVRAIHERSPESNLSAGETKKLIEHVLVYREAVLEKVNKKDNSQKLNSQTRPSSEVTAALWDPDVRCKHAIVSIAGISFVNADGRARREVLEECDNGELLILEPDPLNEYDENAVKVVRQNGDQLGFIPASLSPEVYKLAKKGYGPNAILIDKGMYDPPRHGEIALFFFLGGSISKKRCNEYIQEVFDQGNIDYQAFAAFHPTLSMPDQPNPYSQPEETSGVLVGEAKTPASQRGIWFWLFVGCVVPLALIGLATLGLMVWVLVNLDELTGA